MKERANKIKEEIIPSELRKKLFLILNLLSTCCNIDKSLIESTGKTHGIPFKIKPPTKAIRIIKK